MCYEYVKSYDDSRKICTVTSDGSKYSNRPVKNYKTVTEYNLLLYCSHSGMNYSNTATFKTIGSLKCQIHNKLASLINYAWWNDLMDIRQNKWCMSTAQSIILEFNNIISLSLEVWKERHKPWCSFTVKVCTTMKFTGWCCLLISAVTVALRAA